MINRIKNITTSLRSWWFKRQHPEIIAAYAVAIERFNLQNGHNSDVQLLQLLRNELVLDPMIYGILLRNNSTKVVNTLGELVGIKEFNGNEFVMLEGDTLPEDKGDKHQDILNAMHGQMEKVHKGEFKDLSFRHVIGLYVLHEKYISSGRLGNIQFWFDANLDYIDSDMILNTK